MESTHTVPGPIQPGERLHALDVVRGFALLGILLMNIEYFQRPMQAVMLGFNPDQVGLDYWTAWLVYVFVQGKFYTMFSLLFGMGFVIFLDRAMQKGASARMLFMRRLSVLLIIGIIHAFGIWSGDILLTYALVGFLLLLWAKTPARRLWKWGVGFVVFPVVLMWLGGWSIEIALQSPGAADVTAQFKANAQALASDIAAAERIYTEGSWVDAVAWRVHEVYSLYIGSGGTIFFIVGILGMFLIGASFARGGVFHAPDANRRVFVRMTVLGYLVGIPCALYTGMHAGDLDFMMPSYTTAKAFSAATVANFALCLAYVGTIVLLLRSASAGRALMRLAPAGRMALTNYLTHSIVFTLLFYGYGLGLWGEFGRFATTLMAIALYAGQVWVSAWWLARHRMGPTEWLWRTATYGHRPA